MFDVITILILTQIITQQNDQFGQSKLFWTYSMFRLRTHSIVFARLPKRFMMFFVLEGINPLLSRKSPIDE